MVSPETEAKTLHQELMTRSPPGGVTPTDDHVLLGRGKSHLNHMGNVWFQKIIEETVPMYWAEKSIHVKRKITYEIVCRIMKERGGFLRWKKNRWERIPLEDQRQKVAHALQYRIRSMNKEEQHKRDEMIAHQAQMQMYHGKAGGPQQHRFSYTDGNDLYHKVTSSNSNQWAKTSLPPNDNQKSKFLVSMVPHVPQFIQQAPSPPSVLKMSHPSSTMRRIVVPKRKREPTSNSGRPYTHPMHGTVLDGTRTSSHDGDNQIVERRPLDALMRSSSPKEKRPLAPTKNKPPDVEESDNCARREKSKKRRKNPPGASVEPGIKEASSSDKLAFYSKELRSIQFLAVSSSHQLSAENAIYEQRPQSYRKPNEGRIQNG